MQFLIAVSNFFALLWLVVNNCKMSSSIEFLVINQINITAEVL